MEHAASYMTLAEMQRLAKLPIDPIKAKEGFIRSVLQSLRVEGYIVSQEQAEAAFDRVFGNKE